MSVAPNRTYCPSIPQKLIRSIADKRSAAVFVGHALRSLLVESQPLARAKLPVVDAAVGLDDLCLSLATASKRSGETNEASTVSVLAIDGGSVSIGEMPMHWMSRSPTTIEEDRA